MPLLPRVVVTHRVHDEILAFLGAFAEVVANQTEHTLPRAELVERARGAAALIAFMPDRIDAAFLDACPALRIVAGALRGYDNFDVAACTARGVWLTVVPELLAEATAELGVGLLIALARRVPEGDGFVRGGTFRGWKPHLYARGIAGSDVGIAGFGQLGRAFAARLAPFGARVAYADQIRASADTERALGVAFRPLDALIRESDHLVLSLPLNAGTLRILDAQRIATMRPGALLVNLARGSLVDEAAVAAALESGALGGYASDVYAFEDWAVDDRPRTIAPALVADRARTLFTPHLGSAVSDVRLDIERTAARAVGDVLHGKRPEHAVNQPAARE